MNTLFERSKQKINSVPVDFVRSMIGCFHCCWWYWIRVYE